jgi:electron transport complex protein RnfC
MHLMPNYIYRYAKNEMYDEAEKYNVLDCIECGACSYSCPAKIQLVQMMRLTKFKVTSNKKREG